MGVLLLLSGIWYPPEFPKLLEGYSEWKRYDNSCLGPDDSMFHARYTGQNIDTTITSLPYTLKTDLFNIETANGDTICGMTSYYNYNRVEGTYSFQVLTITAWNPHHKTNEFDQRPMDPYGGYISYDTLGFQKITINGNEAYRIRGKWWRVACDGGAHVSGSFTNYYIPTEKLVFRITCISRFYLYDECGPDPSGVEHYPDRIAELERAVEETFRPK